ncbi:C2 domain-containing protein [Schizosaccharomyces pombe]
MSTHSGDSTKQQHYRSSDPYSGRRPIPTIPKFFRDRKQRAEKKEEQQREQTENEKLFDPITQRDVEINDVHFDYAKTYDDPSFTVPNQSIQGSSLPSEKPYLSSNQPANVYKQHQDDLAPPEADNQITRDVPISDEKTNILFFPSPSIDLSYVSKEVKQKTGQYSLFAYIFSLVVSWFFTHSIIISAVLPLAISSCMYLWMQNIYAAAKDAEWGAEQKRGEYARLNLIPESAEWMNHLLEKVWPLINPEMFSSVADQIEDVMQASIPSFVENVRVASLDQGSHPVRVVSIRSLPSGEASESFSEKQASEAEHKDEPEQQRKQFYNLELCLAYHAKPVEDATSTSARASNLHLRIVFYPGIKGTVGFPLPIWVEIKGFVARIRFRCELMPEVPFLKNVTFSLMGLPELNVSAVPVAEGGVNIFGLPLISKFVNDAISAAANEYVSPRSMTIDLSKTLLGDDIKKEVNALGVIFVHINRAEDLSKQDVNGLSDAYITVGFHKFGKPLYCTRVVKQDLNPIWNEYAFIPVFPDQVKAGEKISIELWDSDRFSPDDVVGRTKIGLHLLIQDSGKMHERCDTLTGISEDTSLPGRVFYEIGYFPRAEFKPSLKTSGHDITIPRSMRDDPDFQNPHGSLDNKEEEAAVTTAPDEEYPSGILSFTVHQAVNLQMNHPTGTFGNVSGNYNTSPAQSVGDVTAEEGSELPSSYVCVDLDDTLVYKTRTKVFTSNPIYNAGSEKFVKDWRNAMLCFTVRDFKLREHDSILGVVNIPLATTLTTSSQLTKWYPIQGGIGFGSVRISILFRSMKLKIPRNLLGWDIGTLEFMDRQIVAEGTGSVSDVSFSSIRVNIAGVKITAKSSTSNSSSTAEYHVRSRHAVIPVNNRYRSAVVFEFRKQLQRKHNVFAMVWLVDLEDNVEQNIRVPIFTSSKPAHVLQNMIDFDHPDKESEFKIIGYLSTRICFHRGLDDSHEQLVDNDDEAAIFETYRCLKSMGLRRGYVKDMKNPLADQRASLDESRETTTASSKFESDDSVDTEDEETTTDRTPIECTQTVSMVDPNVNGDIQGRNSLGTMNSNERNLEQEFISLGYASKNRPKAHAQEGTNQPGASENVEPVLADDSDAVTIHSNISSDDQKRKLVNADDRELEKRLHRGPYNSKIVRTGEWVKDGAKMGWRNLRRKFALNGRQPDVETEISK